MVIALGYASAVLIGVLLGLMGGGGAVIVVPVLVYLFDYDAVTATAYSLFIVSIAAFVGFLRNLAKGLVDVRTGIVFAIPAGALPYFVIGTPTLIWALGRWGPRPNLTAALGGLAVVLMMGLVGLSRRRRA